MFHGKLVIDVHGHMSAPPAFRAFAYNLIALRTPEGRLVLSEDQMKGPIDRHLRLLDSHGIDVQLISPRPVAMMHWEQPRLAAHWTRVTNDVIASQCTIWETRFVGIAQLPQNVDIATDNCVKELERCAALGFVGALVNPDPGGDGRTPGMNEEYWYPLYEAAQGLDMTLVVHPSISRDPRLAIISHSYQFNNAKEEGLATLLLEQSDVFERFSKLRIIVCHCGGMLDRNLEIGRPVDAVAHAHGAANVVRPSGEEAGGSVGIQQEREEQHHVDVSENLFFDTCAYDPSFLAAAIKQRGVERMVFGTEVPGSASDMWNPELDVPADDVLSIIDSFSFLSAEDKLRIVHENPIRLFPRLADTPALAQKAV